MANKFLIGLFLALFLSTMSLVLAREKTSQVPAKTKQSLMSKNCDCRKENSISPSSSWISDVPDEEPPRQNKECSWECDYRCYLWVGPECVWEVFDCVLVCPPNNPGRK